MEAPEESPTFADLIERGQSVVWTCMAPGRHTGPLNLEATEAAERFGAATTIEQIRRRLRCTGCGHRGDRMIVEVYTRGQRRRLSNDYIPV